MAKNPLQIFFDHFESRAQLPPDPITDLQNREGTHAYANQRGQVMQPTQKGERGTILEAFPKSQTYLVASDTQGTETMGRILQNPSDSSMLTIGTCVAITRAYGAPFILGVLPFSGALEDNNQTLSLTGDTNSSGNNPLYTGKDKANYRMPSTPSDILPGDHVISGAEGNSIGVLGGGVNVIKSGNAQIQTHLLNDQVHIICRNHKLTTDMGVTETKNDGGRISYTFRGGADQLTEAAADQENWVIRFDLGAEGDLFNLRLTRPNGLDIFKFHVDNDGHVEIFGAQGVDITGGGPHTQKHLQDRVTVIKQSDSETVGNDQTKTVQGNKSETISNNYSQAVGTDRAVSAMRHETRSIGGNLTEKIVGGGTAVAKPTNVAYDLAINNGSWEVNIGDPTAGASPAALAGYKLNTFVGDITMKVKTKGDIKLSTLLGNVETSTLAGNVAMTTAAGTANVDGTTVLLGTKGMAPANPLVKGTLHSTAFASYTAANIAAVTPAMAATTALTAIVAPPLGMIFWYLSPIMSNAMAVWLASILAALSALLAANTALAAAVPATLSTQCFTA